MKKLIITISIILLSIIGYGQNLLNWTSEGIIEEKGQPTEITKDDSGNPYLFYSPGKGCEAEAYYMTKKDNICYLYISIHDYSELTIIIKELNTSFEKINTNLWKYYMKDYICYAEIIKNESNFMIGFYMKSYTEQIKTTKI